MPLRRVIVAVVSILGLVAGARVALSPGSSADAATVSTTFAAVADGGVDAAAPNAPWSGGNELVADATPARSSYVRFTVAGVSGTVERAVLRLHVRDRTWAPSPSTGRILAVANTTWTEAGLTYASRSAVGAVVTSGTGAATRNTWVEFDVTSAVRANGAVAFAVASTNDKGVYYDSRESGTLGPQLVVSASTPITTTTTPGATVTTALVPVADATIDASAPTTNLGADARLVVGAQPDRRTLVRFDLAGITGTITKAELRLHVRDAADAGSSAGGTVDVLASTTWTESAVTWATRPAVDSEAWRLGAVDRDAWVAMDMTWAARAGTPIGFQVSSTSADAAIYDAREAGALAPQLVVTSQVASTSTSTLYAVGDIARCDDTADEATSALLDGTSGLIAGLGDLAYPNGSAADFANCFHPSWGRHKARIRPVPGNHEYKTAGATPYFDYFGAAAGQRPNGWYTYDLGSWHVIAINSNCESVGGCGAGSVEEAWLRADLAATAKPCILAYWHYPLFDSGTAEVSAMKPFWTALREAGADVVLNGHAHGYERFALQSPSGAADAGGIRQFTVGTGGAESYVAVAPAPNSQVRSGTYGVLRLTLGPSSYTWKFLPVAGSTFTDTGTTACH